MKEQNFLFLHPFPAIRKEFIFAKHAHLGLHYGLGVLAQMAIDKGYKVKVVAYSDILKLNKILNEPYDWIFITTFTNQIPLILNSLKLLAEKDTYPRVVIGGVHATFAPEDFNNYPYGFLVRGEGEIFMRKLLNNEDFSALPGVFKKGEEITQEFAPIIRDLDEIPYPFRYITPRQASYRLDVLTQRGCIFSCPYCVDLSYRKIYKGYLRRRSPKNVITEIKNAAKGYWHLMFSDDNFYIDQEWMKEFIELYSNKIKLSFTIKTRSIYVTKEILHILKKAGCFRLQMGIEHGDYETRKNLMCRNETDEQIIESFQLAKSMGFQTISYNMLGLPDDTEEDILKLIELNRKAEPTYIYYSLFQPYPGTILAEYAKNKNIAYAFRDSYFRWDSSQIGTLPQLSGISKERLSYYFQNFIKLIKRKQRLACRN